MKRFFQHFQNLIFSPNQKNTETISSVVRLVSINWNFWKKERNKSIKCKSVWVIEINEYRGLFGHFEIVKLLKKTESNVAMKS